MPLTLEEEDAPYSLPNELLESMNTNAGKNTMEINR